MPQPLLDDRQVGAAREEPRGVGVAQVVDPDANPGIRCFEGRQPDVVAEPPAGDAPIRIDGPRSSGRVRSADASIRSVDGKRSPAVGAPALARRVGAERPMPVPATGVIRLGQPELLRVRDDLEPRSGLTDARHGEEQIIRPQTVPLGMRGELGNDMRAELHTAVLLSLWVVPDQQLSPVRMELRVELDLDPADAQDPGTGIQVPWPQFNESPPPQAGLDGGLDQQLGTSVWERLIDRIELFRGHDGQRYGRNGWGLDAFTRVQKCDLVVQSSGEDRTEDALEDAQVRRADLVVRQLGDPLAHISGHDLVHPHRAEPRHDVLVDRVGVALTGGRLDHVVRQPFHLDIPLESLPPPPRIPQTALGQSHLGRLPRMVGVLLLGKGAGNAGLPAGITVVGGVALLPVLV